MRFFDRWMRSYAWWRKWRGLPEPMSAEKLAMLRDLFVITDDILKDCVFTDRSYRASPVSTPTIYRRGLPDAAKDALR